ncbi:MAG: hypothetical protein KatS3mg061_1977 [Dehalococcoidia bacterium]|nr:MAG: hypothetical protein KatS3mg061_1977 [Dehalococcoidia bacterium]
MGLPKRPPPGTARQYASWPVSMGSTSVRSVGAARGGRVTRQDVLALVARQAATSTDEEVVPLSPLRRQLAERLSRLVREVPLAWTLQEVDVTGLVALREATKAAFS